MSAVADAMLDVADAEPQQGAVPSAIAKAARFLVDLKSGKVSAKSEDTIGAANVAGPARRDNVATGNPSSGRPSSDRIAAAHAAAQRALGISPAAGKTEEPRQEPRLGSARTTAETQIPQTAAPIQAHTNDTPGAASAAPQPPRPVPQSRPARPAEVTRARPAAPIAAHVPPPSAPARPPLSIKQYLRELQFQVSGHNQAEVRQALVEVTPGEIERVTRVVAKLRGRYLAQVLELGQAIHKPIPEGEIKQLKGMREMYEEAARGLDYLKDAIDKDEVGLNGVFM